MLNAPIWALWVGLVGSFIAGASLRWWASARRFERRNELGVELYSSYSDMMGSKFVEGLANMLGGILLAVTLGFVMLIGARMLLGS